MSAHNRDRRNGEPSQIEMALAAQTARPQQPVGLQVALPINDIQLIAMMAMKSHRDTAANRVQDAMETFAETVAAFQDGTPIKEMIQAAARRQQLTSET